MMSVCFCPPARFAHFLFPSCRVFGKVLNLSVWFQSWGRTQSCQVCPWVSHIVKILSFAVFQKWLWSFARPRVIMGEGVQARLICQPGFQPRTQAFFGV